MLGSRRAGKDTRPRRDEGLAYTSPWVHVLASVHPPVVSDLTIIQTSGFASAIRVADHDHTSVLTSYTCMSE